MESWHSFSKEKLYVLTLIDEHEREETRQLYEELNNNVEVSDVACKKAQMWSELYGYVELSELCAYLEVLFVKRMFCIDKAIRTVTCDAGS